MDRTMALSMDMLTWKGEIVHGVLPIGKEQQATNDYWGKEN